MIRSYVIAIVMCAIPVDSFVREEFSRSFSDTLIPPSFHDFDAALLSIVGLLDLEISFFGSVGTYCLP